MKLPRLLLGMFTLLLCFFATEMNAQCQKKKSSCSKSRTEKSDTKEQKYDNAVYRYYNAARSAYKQCDRQRSAYRCNKDKSDNARKKIRFDRNYTGLLAGIVMLDDNQSSFNTGVEYGRFLNRTLAVGVSVETTFGQEANVTLGLPVSFQLGKRLRLMASPLGAFQQNEVIDRTIPVAADEVITTTEWNNSIGARAGIAYYITTKGLKIAPMLRADYLNNDIRMNIGLTAGLGF